MKNTYTINHADAKIIITNDFARSASKYGTKECALLATIRNQFPGYTIATRTISRNEKQKRYKGLNYAAMEKYINDHDIASMAEYTAVRKSAASYNNSGYSKVKKWFLDKYKDQLQISEIENVNA